MTFTPFNAFNPTYGNVTAASLTVTGNVSAQADLNLTGHLNDLGITPTVNAGGQAGTTPPAPVVPQGTNDDSGLISFGTGTTPAAGVMVAITFATAWVVPGGGAPHIVLTEQNLATKNLGLFVTGTSPTGFNVSCVNAPAASQGNTTYQFSYHVRG